MDAYADLFSPSGQYDDMDVSLDLLDGYVKDYYEALDALNEERSSKCWKMPIQDGDAYFKRLPNLRVPKFNRDYWLSEYD